MANQGTKTYTINPGGSQTIPAGYHSGSGTVTANANQNSGTYTFAANSTGATVDMGVNNTYRYVNATNVYNKGKDDGAGYTIIKLTSIEEWKMSGTYNVKNTLSNYASLTKNNFFIVQTALLGACAPYGYTSVNGPTINNAGINSYTASSGDVSYTIGGSANGPYDSRQYVAVYSKIILYYISSALPS